MLRKMSRSLQKDQNMGNPNLSHNGCESDFMEQKQKTNSFFTIPGLFVGLNPKSLLDCDSVNSPTSPLDFRVFSNLTNPFRSPKSQDGHFKCWNCSKVGLSIIDGGNDTNGPGVVNRSSECKNIVVGPQMRIKSSNFGNHFDFLEEPKSLPKNYAISNHAQIKSSNLSNEVSGSLFKIGEDPVEPVLVGDVRSCSLDSGRRFPICKSVDYREPNLARNTQVNSPQFNGRGSHFVSNFPTDASCISGSMDSLGGRPLTNEIGLSDDRSGLFQFSEVSAVFHSNNFLSFCYSCSKKLDGEDIYMYRGEKAFCSLTCREQEILNDRELEEEDTVDDLPETTFTDDNNN